MSPDLSLEASIVIVSYNTRELLKTCLQSVLNAIGERPIKVITIDNDSRDGSADMVSACFPQVHLVRSTCNLGFAAANNFGFRHASGRYVILLNPDALLDEAALSAAINNMDRHPEVGLAGGRLVDAQGRAQPSARQFPSLLNELLVLSGLAHRYPRSRLFGRFDMTWSDPMQAAEVDWVPGAFTIMRSSALREVGPFDERFFLYYEEVDLCRRFKAAGWPVWYWPDILVRHIGGASSQTVEGVAFSNTGSQLTLWRMRSGLLYYRKHHGLLTAWMVARLETCWHSLRALKAHLTDRRDRAQSKCKESRHIVSTMHRAWIETLGGQVSPRRPW